MSRLWSIWPIQDTSRKREPLQLLEEISPNDVEPRSLSEHKFRRFDRLPERQLFLSHEADCLSVGIRTSLWNTHRPEDLRLIVEINLHLLKALSVTGNGSEVFVDPENKRFFDGAFGQRFEAQQRII